jgi:hypothetical protein
MRLVLEHLRDVRNHLVHEHGIKSNIDSYFAAVETYHRGLNPLSSRARQWTTLRSL